MTFVRPELLTSSSNHELRQMSSNQRTLDFLWALGSPNILREPIQEPRSRRRVDGPQYTRKAIRFPLEALPVFWWLDSGVVKRSEGRTRDISETGAFVLAADAPLRGSRLASKSFFQRSRDLNAKQGWKQMGRSCVLNGHEVAESDGLAILIGHILLRVNNDVFKRVEGAAGTTLD